MPRGVVFRGQRIAEGIGNTPSDAPGWYDLTLRILVEEAGGARVVHLSPALSTADVDRNYALNPGHYCAGETCAIRVRNFAARVRCLSFDQFSVYRSVKSRQSSLANVGLTIAGRVLEGGRALPRAGLD